MNRPRRRGIERGIETPECEYVASALDLAIRERTGLGILRKLA
jgi:hypothetical protein